MKLIAGLGNPGRRYEGTRHNAGYAIVEELSRRWSVDLSRVEARFEALLGQARVGSEEVWLMKPLTFMNLSGRSLGAFVRFYKLPLADLLVCCDDMDLPTGQLRLRPRGSAGGQKGLSDVLRHLGSDEFSRLRFGIGRVHRDAHVEYVTSRFEPSERDDVQQAIAVAADAAECWVRRGIDAAMNDFNRKPGDDRRTGEQPGADGPE
ncbi:MAG: Peptidyl-tRNA hydrolase [Phycisphaerae bacterium]|nr:Peptidyl-tRNA hydrolase [Phycisphaerae bacterium]